MPKYQLNSKVPNGTVHMIGNLPENSGGTIYYGGEAAERHQSVSGNDTYR